jgi:hypothetical protein
MYVLNTFLAKTNELSESEQDNASALLRSNQKMWNRYRPYRRGIRFFPHIIPIAFPLIFPLGIGLVYGLFHALFNVLGILLLVALAFFIFRAITLGSPQAAWDSMWKAGSQWQQKFTSRSQQPPYYQPQQPYYQPSSPAGQEQPSQPYGQGYQPEQPLNQQESQYNDYGQSRTQYPEQMPPMQQ